MLNEFKKFALKGNVVDMAVGIVIGAAFSAVVKSLVDNIITPPLGYLTGKVDFSEKSWSLPVANGDPIEITWGQFVNSLISFLIVAIVLFFVVRMINRVREQFEEAEDTPTPTTTKCPECMMEIPLKARRCGHCTAVFPSEADKTEPA